MLSVCGNASKALNNEVGMYRELWEIFVWERYEMDVVMDKVETRNAEVEDHERNSRYFDLKKQVKLERKFMFFLEGVLSLLSVKNSRIL